MKQTEPPFESSIVEKMIFLFKMNLCSQIRITLGCIWPLTLAPIIFCLRSTVDPNQ